MGAGSGRRLRCAASVLVLAAATGCAALPAPDDRPVAAPAPATSEPAPAPTRAAATRTPRATAAPTRAAAASPRPTAPRTTGARAAALLQQASGGDGDSWRDTAGREYRLGLVNAPEVGECYGNQATAKRKSLLRNGFTASTYATDDYGRSVSVVRTRDGVVVNVHLARYGFVDDRYLEQFRGENPGLARQLDAAFGAAKREQLGLWGACDRGAQEPQGIAAPPPARSACHPSYVTCIPVQGDGSGNGAANDLDCGDLDGPVRLRSADDDPYRLDRDGDLLACE